jgi:hypothetical protein
MRALLVLMFLIAVAPAIACTPKLQLTVTAEHTAPVLQTTYALAQIRSLAHAMDYHLRHDVYGFYVSVFGYMVAIDRSSSECGEVGAKVRLRLSNRVVEIARDLEDQGCRPGEVISHYMAQARTDDEVLSLYAERIRKRLAATPTSFFLRSVGEQTDVNPDVIGKSSIAPWKPTMLTAETSLPRWIPMRRSHG